MSSYLVEEHFDQCVCNGSNSLMLAEIRSNWLIVMDRMDNTIKSISYMRCRAETVQCVIKNSSI